MKSDIPMSLSYFRPRSYLIWIHVSYLKTPHLFVLGKICVYVLIFLSCSLTRNVASVKGYDDHNNVSRFNFSPAVFMKAKTQPKPTLTYLVSFWIYRLAQTLTFSLSILLLQKLYITNGIETNWKECATHPG